MLNEIVCICEKKFVVEIPITSDFIALTPATSAMTVYGIFAQQALKRKRSRLRYSIWPFVRKLAPLTCNNNFRMPWRLKPLDPDNQCIFYTDFVIIGAEYRRKLTVFRFGRSIANFRTRWRIKEVQRAVLAMTFWCLSFIWLRFVA